MDDLERFRKDLKTDEFRLNLTLMRGLREGEFVGRPIFSTAVSIDSSFNDGRGIRLDTNHL